MAILYIYWQHIFNYKIVNKIGPHFFKGGGGVGGGGGGGGRRKENGGKKM